MRGASGDDELLDNEDEELEAAGILLAETLSMIRLFTSNNKVK